MAHGQVGEAGIAGQGLKVSCPDRGVRCQWRKGSLRTICRWISGEPAGKQAEDSFAARSEGSRKKEDDLSHAARLFLLGVAAMSLPTSLCAALLAHFLSLDTCSCGYRDKLHFTPFFRLKAIAALSNALS